MFVRAVTSVTCISLAKYALDRFLVAITGVLSDMHLRYEV